MEKLDLLVLLSAIGTEEGYFEPGTIPNICNNPGDLHFAGQPGAVASTHGHPPFAQFDCAGRGIAGNLRQILKRIEEGLTVNGSWKPMTLRILLCDPVIGWTSAAVGDNPKRYLAETIRRIQVHSGLVLDPDKPLWDYLTIEAIP